MSNALITALGDGSLLASIPLGALLLGLFAGALGGLLASLAGVGGGLVYVPLFSLAMPSLLNDSVSPMAATIFASLVAVAITALFSTRAHLRLAHIDGRLLLLLLPGLAIGAGIGLWSTQHLSASAMMLLLALLNGWIASDYRHAHFHHRLNRPTLALAALPIGSISGLLGIGGGTMLVPLLRRATPLRMAVGTSAACGLCMSSVAVAGNLIVEPAWRDLLAAHASSLIALWLGIALTLPGASRWGARIHHQLSDTTVRLIMRWIFGSLAAAYLLALSTLLLGTP